MMKQYNKYKDSKVAWLGQVPEHWDELFLFQCAEESKASNKGLVNQNLLSLSYGNIIRKCIDATTGLLPASFETYQIVDEGNIVMRLTDLQNDKRSLRTGLVKEKGIITSAYVCLKCKSNVLPKYFHYLLHSFDISKLFYSLGGGLRQGCNYSDLKKVVITIPSLDEQEQIVRYLDWKMMMADKFVREKRREITLLKELRQAEINHAVTRGLDSTVPTKQSEVDWADDIPVHWKINKLKHVCTSFSNGTSVTQTANDESLFHVTRIESISTSEINYNKVGYIDFFANIENYRLRKNDILISNINSYDRIGNSATYNGEKPLYHGMNLLKITPLKINNIFLQYILRTGIFIGQMQRKCKPAINQVSVPASSIKAITIPMPPIEEQQQITEHIQVIEANINKAIEKIENEIALTVEYKTRLISDVTTGQVDVRGIEIPHYTVEEATISDNEEIDE